eukprot:1572940-Pleurochrysis_carterae.AAC.1
MNYVRWQGVSVGGKSYMGERRAYGAARSLFCVALKGQKGARGIASVLSGRWAGCFKIASMVIDASRPRLWCARVPER